jgi:predicted Zn-dependent peptidase
LRAYELEKVKRSLCDSIRADDNDTAAYASKKCREIMCAEEPCGYSISVDDIMRVTPAMISDRYSELSKSNNLSFFYVGEYDADVVADALDLHFGEDAFKACVTRSLSFTCANPHPVVRKERTMQVTQGKLSIGLYAGGITMSDSDDYYATLVAVEIFGGSPISKLFMNVRERLGLCYYCGATYNKQKGIIYVSAGIDPEERENAEREINAQLEQMRQGNISEDELQAAQLSMINVVRQISDRPYSMWSFCHIRTMMGLSTSIDRHIDRIFNVSVQDIARVASMWTVGGVFFVNAENGGSYED